MKRGFLGSTKVDTMNYWTDGKSSRMLKCNETNLYALIDLCQENVDFSTTNEERQLQYSLMDKYFLCLKAIEFAGADDSALKVYGQIIANMEEEGSFDIIFESIELENAFVDTLVERLANGYAEETFNNEFMLWFKEVVIDYNYFQNMDGTRTKNAPKLNGLGEVYNDDYYSKKAKESGMSLLYIACDKSNVLKDCVDNEEMLNKILNQSQTYNWLGSCGTNMTKISVMANIKAGIKASSGYEDPNDTLSAFKRESEEAGTEQKGLGISEVLLLAIIGAVTAIITLITSIIKAKEAEATARVAQALVDAPNLDLVEYNAPAYQDYSEYVERMNQIVDDAEDMRALDVLPILGMGAVAVLAIIFAGKKKKND